MTEKRYKYLIFDADHTLLNYLADERAAFETLYQELGISITEELMAQSRRYSEETWTEAGLYNVHEKRIQETYHALYRSHVEGIFERIFAQFGYHGSVSAKEAGEKFLKNLEREGIACPFAEELLSKLCKKYCVCIATNGLSPIQHGRLRRLKAYAKKVYVSEDVGTIKPLPAYFNKILSELGANPCECLMIGDSLYSDVAGAKAAGMDACWLNGTGEQNKTLFIPDFEVRSLKDLTKFL